MDLRNDIKKATSLTYVNDNAKFYQLHGLSQRAKDKKMNERKVKKPRNLNVSTYMRKLMHNMRNNILNLLPHFYIINIYLFNFFRY